MSSSRILSLFVTCTALGAISLSACSSSSTPVPRTAIYSALGRGSSHTQEECKLASNADWVVIGTIGPDRGATDPVLPVDNGGFSAGHGVSVDCSVTPSGSGFSVKAIGKLDGEGTVTISGDFAAANGAAKPAAQNNVTGIFQRDEGSFSAMDCVATYPRDEMGIAAGRIWAQIDCKTVTYAAQNRACEAHAEIRFENCAQ